MISALNGDGVADLKALSRRARPAGPWHYPADEITDTPLRMLAAEITREKIYDRLHDELPYAGHGRDDDVEGAARTARCASSRRSSSSATARRRIVLGKGGQTIKQISMEARHELAEILEQPGAPVPVRQGARGLGGRSRALPRDGP